MRKIERENIHLHQVPKTAKELVHVLGANLSTLNKDTYETQEMPSILPGEKGMRHFTTALRENGFTNLAEAITVVHLGESRRRKDKNFPSLAETNKFETYSAVIRDLSTAVFNNISLLDNRAQVKPNHYKVEIRVGEIVLTFYELALEEINMAHGFIGSMTNRAEDLSKQNGFKPTSLIEGLGLVTQSQAA